MTQETSLQVLHELQKRAQQAEASKDQAVRTTRHALWALGGVTLVSVAVGAIFATRFPMERYIYTDNAKAICEAQLEDQPLVTASTVTDFAKECTLDIDTFGHDSVERDLSRMADRCLTPEFRKTFFEASWMGSRIDTVRSGFLRTSSQTTGPVLITSSGPTAQGYLWKVQVPIKRTFRQGDTIKGNQERVYLLDVYRVTKNAQNPVGLSINQVTERSK